MDKPLAGPPLKADELDIVELVMELEEEFNVEISDAALERMTGANQGKRFAQVTPAQLAALVKSAPKLSRSLRKK